MRLGTNDKDIEKIAKQAVKEGWIVEVTRGNHLRWKAPDGVTVLISPLTGNSRTWSNFRSMLRKHGLDQGKHHKGRKGR